MSTRDEPRKSARVSDADAEDRPKGKFAYFVGKDATGPIGGARDYVGDAEEAVVDGLMVRGESGSTSRCGCGIR